MKLLKALLAALDGRKTYITGALMVLLGLLQGDDQMVLNGLGFIFVRKAIGN